MGTEEVSLSYEKAGVNIDTADAAKLEMKTSIATDNKRVLNSLGAFASLVDFTFEDITEPVMVMKMEEPGSKQLLAAQHGRLADVGYDLINHLINDTIVMGARAIAIQDTIVCGELQKDIVVSLVETMAKACKTQGVELVGGETSEQPRVIPAGAYILSAACVGVVDKKRIIDGSAVSVGDVVLAVGSNGVHTNGYTLIRALLDAHPELASKEVAGESFLDQVLKPHLCYNHALQKIFTTYPPTALAHITGGGIVDNLSRVIPDGVQAEIDLDAVQVLPIFKEISQAGSVAPADMLRTFNLGVGLTIVCKEGQRLEIESILRDFNHQSYQIGVVKSAENKEAKVVTRSELSFA